MKEYRKRFVQLNMLLIGLVLLIMNIVVAVYMCRDYYNGLEATMQQVVQPWNSYSSPPKEDGGKLDADKPKGDKSGPDDSKERKLDPESQKNIMTVFYTEETGEFSILSNTTEIDSTELEQLLKTVSAQEDSFGILFQARVIYYRSGNGDPYKIALASTSYITHSMLQLMLLLLGIWLGAMLCFLLVSILLSKVAVRPMEEAMRREKQFVADASHDLKTPLSVILANNSILRENPDATVGSLARWTDSTQTAAKNMQRLIGEMLTLADVERQEAPIVLEPVDFSAVVTKAALQLESVAYEKHVALETEIPEQLMLRANEDYLQRISASLMENAIKYEPSGGQVRVCLTGGKHRASLKVSNQNALIAEADLPHVFDRFYRSDKSRQGDSGGHGLGLSITRQMVEALRGSITVESSPKTGTVFTVTFPL